MTQQIERVIRHGKAMRSGDFNYPKFVTEGPGKRVFDFARMNYSNLNDCLDYGYSIKQKAMAPGSTGKITLGNDEITIVKYDADDKRASPDDMTLKRFSAVVADAAITMINEMVKQGKPYSEYATLNNMVYPLSAVLPHADQVLNLSPSDIVKPGTFAHMYIAYKFFRSKGDEFVALSHPSLYIFDMVVRTNNPVTLGLYNLLDEETIKALDALDDEDYEGEENLLYRFMLSRVISKNILRLNTESPMSFRMWMEANDDAVRVVVEEAKKVPHLVKRGKANQADIAAGMDVIFGRNQKQAPAGASNMLRQAYNTIPQRVEDDKDEDGQNDSVSRLNSKSEKRKAARMASSAEARK